MREARFCGQNTREARKLGYLARKRRKQVLTLREVPATFIERKSCGLYVVDIAAGLEKYCVRTAKVLRVYCNIFGTLQYCRSRGQFPDVCPS